MDHLVSVHLKITTQCSFFFSFYNPVLLLVEFSPLRFILLVDIAMTWRRECVLGNMLHWLIEPWKKRQNLFFDVLIWLLQLSFLTFHVCYSFFLCRFFNSLTWVLFVFFIFDRRIPGSPFGRFVIVFKLMCFTHTSQGYIHQQKIASANKNCLSNLLMHVWKIQNVSDQYKNNLKQKA